MRIACSEGRDHPQWREAQILKYGLERSRLAWMQGNSTKSRGSRGRTTTTAGPSTALLQSAVSNFAKGDVRLEEVRVDEKTGASTTQKQIPAG